MYCIALPVARSNVVGNIRALMFYYDLLYAVQKLAISMSTVTMGIILSAMLTLH